MARNRASAKQAGTRFERLIADHLRDNVDEDIDRMPKYWANDRGDIKGLKHLGQRIAIETKDYGGQLKAGTWITEAHAAMGNSDSGVGLVVAKRRGTTKPGDQWVLTTLDDLIALLTGEPRQLP